MSPYRYVIEITVQSTKTRMINTLLQNKPRSPIPGKVPSRFCGHGSVKALPVNSHARRGDHI